MITALSKYSRRGDSILTSLKSIRSSFAVLVFFLTLFHTSQLFALTLTYTSVFTEEHLVQSHPSSLPKLQEVTGHQLSLTIEIEYAQYLTDLLSTNWPGNSNNVKMIYSGWAGTNLTCSDGKNALQLNRRLYLDLSEDGQEIKGWQFQYQNPSQQISLPGRESPSFHDTWRLWGQSMNRTWVDNQYSEWISSQIDPPTSSMILSSSTAGFWTIDESSPATIPRSEIPEPTSVILLGTGMLWIAHMGRLSRKFPRYRRRCDAEEDIFHSIEF